ncbi:MAG: glycerate kinase [Lachnospiraceae bacterium]|nr:glycerate kinase [Lachnospiraceae bacterium]
MKFLFASDSFKGTLSSEEISGLLAASARKYFPDCTYIGIPIADGGEGTVDAVIQVTKGSYRKVAVKGPLFEDVEASYGVIDSDSAIIEMAAASGLPMVPAQKRNPLHTTTYGTGQLIRDALEQGYRHISVAIGGSATNDGGMGAMAALGVRFLDENGKELSGVGADLARVRDIDVSGLHPAVKDTVFTVMCDVNNPLTGPTGATHTFGPQKGAEGAVLEELEEGMKNYAAVIREKLGVDVDPMPGAGAAGGLGAALTVFLRAELKSGVETVLDLIRFDELLQGVDLVVTGEGRIDWQSAYGKVPSGIGHRCQKARIPAVAIVGGMGKGAEEIYDHGIESIIPTINGAMDIEEALSRAKELYENAADRLFRLIRVGMGLCK